jgi:hypothetical protein
MVMIAKCCQSKSEKFVDKFVVVNGSRQSTVPYCLCFDDISENMFGMIGRKMRIHVFVVWFLVNLIVDFVISHGEMVK